MDKIAFIVGERFFYWTPILIMLGAACAAALFLAFYLAKGGRVSAGMVAVPMAVLLSLVFGRLIHWYCATDSYSGFLAAMTPGKPGDYALLGVFAGCLLSAALTWALGLGGGIPEMLDAMSVAGCAGIAVGRLAYFYSGTDRSWIPTTLGLPMGYPIVDPVSGGEEGRMATFLLQAIVAAVLFVVLTVEFFRKDRRKGDVALLFLLVYGASQVVLDSTRYDSLYFRSNGFVSVAQIFGALAMALPAVIYSIRGVKTLRMRKSFVFLWLGLAASVGLAGYMEYFVQRRGQQAAVGYGIMSLSMAAFVTISLVIRFREEARRRQLRRWSAPPLEE